MLYVSQLIHSTGLVLVSFLQFRNLYPIRLFGVSFTHYRLSYVLFLIYFFYFMAFYCFFNCFSIFVFSLNFLFFFLCVCVYFCEIFSTLILFTSLFEVFFFFHCSSCRWGLAYAACCPFTRVRPTP